MHVVPAGVHVVIGRGILHAGGLLDRQGIEIGAHEGGGAIAVAENGDHAVPANVFFYFAVEFGQLGADARRGAFLLVGKLGVAVQIFVKIPLPRQVSIRRVDHGSDVCGIRHSFHPFG